MLLNIRPLNNVATVNSFEVSDSIEIYEGDAQDIYFQLIDAKADLAHHGFNPPGRRYMPPDGSTLTVKFVNIDDTKVINRVATQPFSQDPSIFKISVLSSDPFAGTVSMNLTLTEPTRVLHATFAPGSLLRVR